MSSNIQNFISKDPFAEAEEVSQDNQTQFKVHIRVQQRNGRKTLTTVQGLPQKLTQAQIKEILRIVKKRFACNGTIVNDSEMGDVIQLQGDQRLVMKDFLSSDWDIKGDFVKVHGF